MKLIKWIIELFTTEISTEEFKKRLNRKINDMDEKVVCAMRRNRKMYKGRWGKDYVKNNK